jgi:mannosyltransferase
VSGALLRFRNLSALDLSPDESATWIAASAHSITQVLTVQTRANPGELGLHDLLLHFWIGLFGDSLTAMRALSALAGTIAILLVYLVTREALALGAPIVEAEATDRRDLPAAIAALFFAVSLITIKYSREARMYTLALSLALLQVWFFLRALRRDEMVDYAGLAIATALTIIATFTAGLILVPESIYALMLLRRDSARSWAHVIRAGAALGTGLLIVAPSLLLSIYLRGAAPNPQTWEWIPRPAPWAPIALFNKATGSFAFPLLAILAAMGALRGRTAERRDALDFLLLWAFAPPIFLTIFSYVVQPAFVERYMLSSFVPFFALAALGVMQLQPSALRPGAAALVVVLSLTHVAAWSQRPHGLPWGDATAAAADGIKAGDGIGVAPRAGVNVVRYYLRNRSPAAIVETIDAQPPPAVVIVADSFDREQALAQRYPRVLVTLREVVVRGR